MVTSSVGESRAHVLYTSYTEMVREAGGLPVVVTPGPSDEVDTLLDRLAGIVLSGGGDIDPARYGGNAHETVYEVDPLRDEFELAMVRGAAERRIPTLAICRGMQIANVAFGGTLFEDIPAHFPDALEHRRHGHAGTEPQHRVAVDADSTTAVALGKDAVEVNTIHHQALRQVAVQFRVTGQAPDGVIESIEPTDSSWPMWGVQWHPEYLGVHDKPSIALFQALVAAAADSLT
jgi:putative glutamine amidotransferase